jgi:surface glycoprotein (TIGR04207 family)/PGF-CTERM protein
MTDTHDKIRALFLSALMVFSVFAGTVAFAGTAAAVTNTSASVTDNVTPGSSNGESELRIQIDTDVDSAGNDFNANVSLDPLNDIGVEFTDSFSVSQAGSASAGSVSDVTYNESTNTVTIDGSTSNTVDATFTIQLQGLDASGIQDSSAQFTVNAVDTTADSSPESATVTATVDTVGPSIQNAAAFNNEEDDGNEVVDDGTNGIDVTSGGTTGNAPDAADQLVEVTFDEVVEDAGSGLEASDFRVTLSDETVVTPSGAHDVASGDGQVLLVLEDSDVDNVKQIAEVSVSNAGFADDDGNTVAVSDNQDIEVSTTASSALAEGGSTDGNDPRQVFAGESVAFVTDGVNDDFEINTDAGEFVFSGSTGTNSIVFSFDTTDRNNSAVFTFSGSDISGTQAVGIRSLGLNGQADETSLTDEEALTGTVDANSGGREVTVELFEADADFEDDDPVDSTTVSLDGSGDASFDFGAQSTGNFTVQVTDVSSGVTDTTDDIEVTQAADGEAEFVESTITEQRGDIIEFTVDLQNTANAGVKIGSASAGFLINGTVADGNDDDQATIRINTVNYRISVDGDLSNGLSLEETPDNVLAAANYNLRALEGSTTPDNADDPGNVATGSLVIEERTTSNFRTHVAPGAQFGSFDLNDDDTVDVEDVQAGIEDGVITQRNQIAAGDVLIHQVVASGLDGFINPDTVDAGSDVTDAFFNNVTLNADNPSANGAEIILNVEQDSANANQDAQQLTLDSSNTQVIAGDDQYFLLTDTEQLSNLQTGEQIEATVFLNADRDDQGDNTDSTTNVNAVNFEEFFGEAQVSTTASPEEPEVEFTTTNATASGNGTIAGETNIAPGTEVRIVASAESDVTPSFVKSETVVVQSDGGFNVAFDFTENSAGDDYSLEAEDLGSGAPDISVSTTGTLEAGQATPTQTVTETATGETETDTETETETETDTETETETETDTETETETETDTETATEAPDTETETETDTETATEAPDTETETTTGTSTPGFTAVLGVVALLGAALVALRRQN